MYNLKDKGKSMVIKHFSRWSITVFQWEPVRWWWSIRHGVSFAFPGFCRGRRRRW